MIYPSDEVRYKRHLLKTTFRADSPEMFAEAMRELFASDRAEEYASEVFVRAKTCPADVPAYLIDLVMAYCEGQADIVSRTTEK